MNDDSKNSGSPPNIGQRIANGHAFEEHVIEGGEFPEVSSTEELAQLIDRIMEYPSEYKELSRGREAYWDDDTDTIVITNPRDPDGGTCFRPADGKRYFDRIR